MMTPSEFKESGIPLPIEVTDGAGLVDRAKEPAGLAASARRPPWGECAPLTEPADMKKRRHRSMGACGAFTDRATKPGRWAPSDSSKLPPGNARIKKKFVYTP